MNNRNSEQGSAIIWILIAVGLFAALNFAFNSSSRTSTSVIDDGEANAYANQIIAYGNEVKSAVKRLQLRGCSDTEISFENNIVAGYTNPNAPTNKSCHVFDIAGGGLKYSLIPENALDSTWSTSSTYTKPVFFGQVAITNLGTSEPELLMGFYFLKEEVCIKMNEKFISQNTVPIDNYASTIFTGSYPVAPSHELGEEDAVLAGQKSFCAKRTAGQWPYYIQNLITR